MYKVKSNRIVLMYENAVVAKATGNTYNVYRCCGLTRISPSLVIVPIVASLIYHNALQKMSKPCKLRDSVY